MIFMVILLLTSCSSISNYITYHIGIRSSMNIHDINNLSDLKWKYRPLIISSPNISTQLTISNKQLIERNIAVINIKNNISYLNNMPMSHAFLNSVNKKIDSLNKNIKIILIGLDGNIKKKYSEDININQIFQDIDSMPMRIHELNND